MRDPVLVVQVCGPHVGLRVEPVGHDAPVCDLTDERLDLAMVRVADGHPVERDVGHEI